MGQKYLVIIMTGSRRSPEGAAVHNKRFSAAFRPAPKKGRAADI